MPSALGKKFKMSQIWEENKVIPVTLIKVEPNKVSFIKTKERDGYDAVVLALGKTKKEFKGEDAAASKVDDVVRVSDFKVNDLVTVRGVSKGRGFQGVVKRHGFGGGPKTHGQKNRFRAPGSIGNTALQRVAPGRRMAGRMGNDRVTLKKVRVVGILEDQNILIIKGAVPGARGGLLEISKKSS